MNHELEVKKVYPDAVCELHPFAEPHIWLVFAYQHPDGVGKSCIGSANTPSAAWQSAYERLKDKI